MTLSFDFDTLPDRRATESAKWRAYGDELLPMWVADMDFRSPEPVIQALKARVDHGVFGYPMTPEGLNEAIVAWLYKRHGWEVSPEALVLVPGVVSGFHLAAHAVTRPGDGVVLQTPAYGPFFNVASNVNLVQQETELIQGEDGQYQVDFQAFEACLTGRSRVFMLCNPQNPTGRVFRPDELEKMAAICLRHGLVICSDEIHSDLVYTESKHTPIAMLDPEIAAQTITLFAPSKTFNLAGLKASVAVIPDKKLREKFEGARKGLLGHVNLLGMVAMHAAYAQGEAWLQALLTYLQANRDFVQHFVAHDLPGIRMARPEGTFLAWLDCREAGIPGKPARFFMKKAGVVVNEGEWFGQGGQGFVRLNFGCPRSMLVEALNKMKAALLSQR